MLPPADHKPPPHEPDRNVELLAMLKKQLLGGEKMSGNEAGSQLMELMRRRRLRHRHGVDNQIPQINDQLDLLRKQILRDSMVQASSTRKRGVKVGVKDPFSLRTSVVDPDMLAPGHPDAPPRNGKVKKGVKGPPDIADLPSVVHHLSASGVPMWVWVVGGMAAVLCLASRRVRRAALRSVGQL
jgi:hypothetical protein